MCRTCRCGVLLPGLVLFPRTEHLRTIEATGMEKQRGRMAHAFAVVPDRCAQSLSDEVPAHIVALYTHHIYWYIHRYLNHKRKHCTATSMNMGTHSNTYVFLSACLWSEHLCLLQLHGLDAGGPWIRCNRRDDCAFSHMSVCAKQSMNSHCTLRPLSGSLVYFLCMKVPVLPLSAVTSVRRQRQPVRPPVVSCAIQHVIHAPMRKHA